MASSPSPHGHRLPPWLRFGHYKHLSDVWVLLLAALIVSALVAVLFQDSRLMSSLLWVLGVYTAIWFFMEWAYRRQNPRR